MNSNERPIPDAARNDPNAVEMLRVWIAKRKLHCSIKVGMYRETSQTPEEKAWGIILADIARHVSHALKEGYSSEDTVSLLEIRDSFLNELANPTSPTKGKFV